MRQHVRPETPDGQAETACQPAIQRTPPPINQIAAERRPTDASQPSQANQVEVTALVGGDEILADPPFDANPRLIAQFAVIPMRVGQQDGEDRQHARQRRVDPVHDESAGVPMADAGREVPRLIHRDKVAAQTIQQQSRMNDEQANHDRSFGPTRFADDPGIEATGSSQ